MTSYRVSAIDTRYDVIMWSEQKSGPRAAEASGSMMFLPHYDVHRVSTV